MDKKIIGYKLKWSEGVENVDTLTESKADYHYPKGMIERVVYEDDNGIVLYFPKPLTIEELEQYDEMMLTEVYELIFEL